MKRLLERTRENIRAFLLLRRRLRQPFTSFSRKKELSIFGICLLVSLIIWLLIKLSAEYSTEVIVKLNWYDEPENLHEVNGPPDHVMAFIHGNGFILLEEKYLSSTPLARLSLKKADIRRSADAVDYIVNLDDFSDDLIRQCGFETRVNGFRPRLIRVEYAPYDTLQVPVKAKLNHRMHDTAVKYKVVTKPAEVNVRGIPADLEGVDTLYTLPVSLTKLMRDRKIGTKIIVDSSRTTLAVEHTEISVFLVRDSVNAGPDSSAANRQ